MDQRWPMWGIQLGLLALLACQASEPIRVAVPSLPLWLFMTIEYESGWRLEIYPGGDGQLYRKRDELYPFSGGSVELRDVWKGQRCLDPYLPDRYEVQIFVVNGENQTEHYCIPRPRATRLLEKLLYGPLKQQINGPRHRYLRKQLLEYPAW